MRLLAKIEQALEKAGLRNFELVVVGAGSEIGWLKRHLRHGVFLGVLRGDDLARAYANMDLFVFPSRTDTFGNVVQEAAASGVPVVVTNEGGPMRLVADGVTGMVAASEEEFVARVVELSLNPERMRVLGAAARKRVLGASRGSAFDKVNTAYERCVRFKQAVTRASDTILVKPGITAH